jgi:hypothetical protein
MQLSLAYRKILKKRGRNAHAAVVIYSNWRCAESFLAIHPDRPVWRNMPIECLRRDPQFFAERAYVSRLPILAIASRSFAAVVFGLPPADASTRAGGGEAGACAR